MEKVNLDSLLPREDLEIKEPNSFNNSNSKDTISVSDLDINSFFLNNLFKPDFQRETAEWTGEKIASFIESFINMELIPAIILWRSENGKFFIIDGAHRISALISWINDDYGDGYVSNKFYNGFIPEEQKIISDKTRKYIDKRIGKYEDYKKALISPIKIIQQEDEFIKKARNLSGNSIKVQWVTGDVSSAEKSFFTINQQGVAISDIELEIINSRKTPTAISSRAIMRMGLGHKYWSNFSEESQNDIEKLSEEIYNMMFLPKLETPIKTLDVPMCGKHNSSNSLSLIYEFVKICYPKWELKEIDESGCKTIECLKEVRKVLRLINDNHKSSLGLHPIIYFYSKNGTFQVSTFYAISLFVIELDKTNKKDIFIRNRDKFERIFYNNNLIIQDITRKYRSSKKAMEHIKNFLFDILFSLEKGVNENVLIDNLLKKNNYQYLSKQNSNNINNDRNNFNSKDKNSIFIEEALKHANKCKICNSYIHCNAITIDHIVRKEDGGKANIENGQLAHPYCNTGYKN